MAGKGITGKGLSANLAEMTKNQLYDIMSQMKTLIEQNRQQARQILIQNPPLTKALFQAQIMLGMVHSPQAIPNIQAANQQSALVSQQPNIHTVPVQVSSQDQTSVPQVQPPLRKQQQPQQAMSTSSASGAPVNLQSQPIPSHSLPTPQQQPKMHINPQPTAMSVPQSSQLQSVPPPPSLHQPQIPSVTNQLQHPLQTTGFSHLPLQPPLSQQARPPSMPPFHHQYGQQMGPGGNFQHTGAPQHLSQPMFHLANKHQPNIPHSPVYHFLVQAGPRLRQLRQVHAHIIVSGSGHYQSLLTKLLTLACIAGSINYTRQIFLFVPNPDSFLFNTVIRYASKFHNFSIYSLYFYRRMLLARVLPSSYSFTSVIKACAALSALEHGKVVHGHVLMNGFGLDVYVQAALVAFYGKSGDLGNARKVFDKMRERSVVSWNSMISVYEQNGFAKEAIELFNEMREVDVVPESTTFVSVLSACAQSGALSLGCWVHEYIAKNGLDLNVVLDTSLINMYVRCGDVRKAREVFDSMREKNVIAWTSMISGYGVNGYGNQAVELFHEMKRSRSTPNSITFVAVLSACAHAGLVNEGRRVFVSMREDYGLVPGVEHHVCLVDMLGRAGLLDEAYKFIKEKIPQEPAPAIWTAMLGACKMHKNFDLGVQVAEHLLAVEPENPGHYVMLSNIYAVAGRMERVEMIRNKMICKSLKKQVGYSTIEVGHKTYLFSMGDKSHPETNEIYRYLDKLMLRCREAGYVTVPGSVMHELEEEEREYALRYHSEKLAIAFGLLRTSHGSPIRIVKNLRMCEDCHTAIKYISVVADREIVVRDKLRFHHFKDGSCSCLDYW